MPWLTLIVMGPLVAAVWVALLPREYRVLFRFLAVGTTLLSLLGALRVFAGFDPAQAGFQFEEYVGWIDFLGAGYHLGLDGLSAALLLPTAAVVFAAACWAREITHREKEFYLLLLVMSGGVLGAFVAQDLLLMFVFHELALIPTFLGIGIWGRGEEREYAAFKLTIYLTLGSLLVLVGLIGVYAGAEFRSLDVAELRRHLAAHPMPVETQKAVFGVLMFGFGILAALWPFHTWAPMGYATAPSAMAVIHAGALKNFGLYGLIRVAVPMLPEGAAFWLPWLGWLAVGNLLYAGWVALRQNDLNLLAGYASVAHIGFGFLGIACGGAAGVAGAVLVMVAYGLNSALLYGLNGWLRQRVGSTLMERYGGLLQLMPFVGGMLALALLAGCGVPGFAGFMGEMHVFVAASGRSWWWTAAALWGAIILAGVYMLRTIRLVLHGPPPERLEGEADVGHWWYRLPYGLLAAGLIWFGLWPRALTDKVLSGGVPVAAPERVGDAAQAGHGLEWTGPWTAKRAEEGRR